MDNTIIYNDKRKVLGRFLPENAGFEINSLNLPSTWEYIYQNRDALLKLDEAGPVYAQETPPGGVTMFKRENGQKFSSWAVWISSEQKEDFDPFTNFFRPLVDGKNPQEEPENLKITYLPHKACYSFSHEDFAVKTEFFVPNSGTEIVMRFSIKNIRKKPVSLLICPYFVPYLNPAQMDPWDKYEWYLKSGVGREKQTVFWSQLLSATSTPENRRTSVFWTNSEEMVGAEISYERFVGAGDLSCPQAVMENSFRLSGDFDARFGEYKEDNVIFGYPPIYAVQYQWELAPNEEKVLIQTYSALNNTVDGWMPKHESVEYTLRYFDEEKYKLEIEKRKQYFDKLFSRNKIETGNTFFDEYVNSWLPLQLDWVASLDRGWTTGMRGTRDSAQDYSALLFTDPESCRNILSLIFSCQRIDGWFPRQYSVKGRLGKHDLRNYVDAGAFVIECIYLYLGHSGNFFFLEEKIPWLDSEDKDSVITHCVRALDYYINPEHLGEHGLCKIGEGDWLDSVNRAGVQDRGESVMVSEQVIMCIKYMQEILQKIGYFNEKIHAYEVAAENLKYALLKHAYNSHGYFNGIFTDEGKWIFSECDPDGEERIYGPANWYAVISGVAKDKVLNTVLQIKERLKCEGGYRLYWPPMGKIPMRCVGRAASGDAPAGFAENGNVYNHGAQGFLLRALASAGDGDALFDTLNWMLPFDQGKHPTCLAMSAPYAIVNCWQEMPVFKFRSMFSFLTGSVAMTERGVYEWMVGIYPMIDGLVIDPCIPKDMSQLAASFYYRERRVHLTIQNESSNSFGVSRLEVNGIEIHTMRTRLFDDSKVFIITPDNLCLDDNRILAVL